MLKLLTKNELRDEVALVVGTRPGIIKFSPVIRALMKNRVPFFIIHTGQHYSYNMDRQFFEELGLVPPRYTNDRVCEEIFHGAQTAEMLRQIEAALIDSKPRIVVVGGDANTNLAGALATRKLGIGLAHMEAGLRSNDWRMPEEHNRVMIDHISDVLFAPTEQAKRNLLEDNVKGEIHVVGNTIVDAVYQNIDIARQRSKILQHLNLRERGYFLLTIHREENVDREEILLKLVENVEAVLNEYQMKMILPIHPRTKSRLHRFGFWERVNCLEKLRIIEAVGYLDFLALLKSAAIVLTDSGGVQEEACVLRVPCITLRENTERPETVDVGANRVVGHDIESTLYEIAHHHHNRRNWLNPYGNGRTGDRIAGILQGVLTRC